MADEDEAGGGRKPFMARFAAGLMTGPLPEGGEPAPAPRHAPDLAIELGPRMTDLVRRTPLDDEARAQIATVLSDDSLSELRGPLVAVALMNCLDRRAAEHEAALMDLRALRAAVEKAGKGG